ncbi:MAG TPA: A/G-specific adenine glycosylase [Rubricoccaceae bacterium]|nr:A/G-specific adenine glycosylase [Rubricoccaceae bacterium]
MSKVTGQEPDAPSDLRPSDLPTADLVTPRHVAHFRGALVDWFEAVRRPLPWREEDARGRRDPYRVWLAEVMLQQTRVDQALPYFARFLAAFPTVEALAAAPLDAVLKAWEGLGYYSRARNLHRAAQAVVERHGGRIPDTEAAIRALPGVGDYTAAAVLSLAYGRPLAVLDGNVVRVLARVFAVEADARSAATRRALQAVADRLLDRTRPGAFNEAVMELGATVCTPRSPACARCPLRPVCAAYAAGEQERYPVVSKKKPVPHVTVAVGIVEDGAGRVLVQKRPEDAMLGGLWEFPGGKREGDEPLAETCRRELKEELGVEVEVLDEVARVDHAYSHFTVTLHAFRCRLSPAAPVVAEPTHHAGQPVRWVPLEELEELAFPRANRRLIEALLDRQRRPTLF